MRKIDELDNKRSCLNRAHEQEIVFVLLARDKSAPTTIRYWCASRMMDGKNVATDSEIQEAYKLADAMEQQRAEFFATGEYK